jgi:hypothetical protein
MIHYMATLAAPSEDYMGIGMVQHKKRGVEGTVRNNSPATGRCRGVTPVPLSSF